MQASSNHQKIKQTRNGGVYSVVTTMDGWYLFGKLSPSRPNILDYFESGSIESYGASKLKVSIPMEVYGGWKPVTNIPKDSEFQKTARHKQNFGILFIEDQISLLAWILFVGVFWHSDESVQIFVT